jgi:NAD(P)H-nitrite reductase large subunit
VQEVLKENGWNIMTGKNVQSIEGGGKVEKVVLDDGKEIKADIVIVGKGVRPNVSFLPSSIKVNRGVLVDEKLKAAPDIYAAGDVAETYDLAWESPRVNALWPNAIEQGRIAGQNMVEEKFTYSGSLGMNSVSFYGLPVISAGVTRPPEGMEVLTRIDKEKRIYKKIVLKEGILKGYILVGEIDRAGILTGFIKEKQEVKDFKEALLDEEISLLVLPSEVRKEKVREGVRAGAH